MADSPFSAADAASFAREFQESVGGGFDPFRLLAGERRFHSVFLAPFSPALRGAVDEFLAAGTGPLTAVVKQFEQKGLQAAEAHEHARRIFAAADGMLVVVLADDQAPVTIPQLFFGHLEEDYRKQVVELCGKDFPDVDALRAALLALQHLAERRTRWPRLVADAEGGDDVGTYWTGLGELLIAGVDEGLFASAPERLADLAHWTARALGELAAQDGWEGEQLLVAARCHAVAGEIDAACERAAQLLREYEAEDEAVAVFLEHLVGAAIARRQAMRALRFFDEADAALEELLGGCYELALPRFRCAAAAMASPERMLAEADKLQKADRKSFRHDLNREPLWRVAVEDPGELLDTQEAADRIDRSIAFVAKRLEQSTIPTFRKDDQVRIPARALSAWKAVMDRHRLLD